MKIALTVVLTAALALSLAACSGSKIADGTYTAELDDASAEASHGWRDTLVVEYKGGKITSAAFESYNAEGAKKSEQTPETYPMDPPPSEWIPQLSANVQKAGDSKHLDTIAGATHASASAKALLEAIEKNGKPGETIQVSVGE